MLPVLAPNVDIDSWTYCNDSLSEELQGQPPTELCYPNSNNRVLPLKEPSQVAELPGQLQQASISMSDATSREALRGGRCK